MSSQNTALPQLVVQNDNPLNFRMFLMKTVRTTDLTLQHYNFVTTYNGLDTRFLTT